MSDDSGEVAVDREEFRWPDRFSFLAVFARRKGSRASIAIQSKVFRDQKGGVGMPDRSLPRYRLKVGAGGDSYALLVGKREAVRLGSYDPGSLIPTSTLPNHRAKAAATTTHVARFTYQSSSHTLRVHLFHAASSEEHLGCLWSISTAK